MGRANLWPSMTTDRARLERWRRGAALAAMALASAGIVRPMFAPLAEPSWPAPDEFQTQLDSLAKVLAPVASLVPEGEAIAYACAADEQGNPLPELANYFQFFQAVLAPRRIGRAVDSRYVLAHFKVLDGRETTRLGSVRVLGELAPGLVLVERTGP